ncbi:hypothetical protein B0T16DRAFT_114779 [Cercophora newfieldiana]|uniref:Uncharacterized protein n=1 Tax=Cercophora newfieldiana TaxID=92897 RepID=A0AA40CTC0_9PEZI|nr:hypothetical protein B0T16DRAFT_114779 [Cercophora newfieldiana]
MVNGLPARRSDSQAPVECCPPSFDLRNEASLRCTPMTWLEAVRGTFRGGWVVMREWLAAFMNAGGESWNAEVPSRSKEPSVGFACGRRGDLGSKCGRRDGDGDAPASWRPSSPTPTNDATDKRAEATKGRKIDHSHGRRCRKLQRRPDLGVLGLTEDSWRAEPRGRISRDAYSGHTATAQLSHNQGPFQLDRATTAPERPLSVTRNFPSAALS